MGVPKTIDNDLFGTDHCPGFASAAKYIATSCMEVYQDARVYDTGMIMHHRDHGPPRRLAGRRRRVWPPTMGAGPDLIYLPETDFDMDKFLADVKRIYDEKGNCIVAVSEGIHYADGAFVSEAKTSATDGFGHAQLGGLAAMLADVVKEETGAKVRGIELSLLQRCAAHCASEHRHRGVLYVRQGRRGERRRRRSPARWSASSATRDENGYKCCSTKLFDLTRGCQHREEGPASSGSTRKATASTQEFIDYCSAAHPGRDRLARRYPVCPASPT